MIQLVVREPFKLGQNRYQRGDLIGDAETIATVERDFPRHVMRRAPVVRKGA